MDFSFYDSNNKVKKFSIQIGAEWSKLNIENKILNTIFQKIDDGDKKVSEKEFGILQYLFRFADKYIKKSANNQVLENEELQNVLNKIYDKTINIKDLRNHRIDNINLDDYSLESLKKRYPKDKYEIVKNSAGINIYDKKNNELILRIESNEYVTNIIENPYTDKEVWRYYTNEGNTGKLNSYTVDGKKHVVLADDIYKEISARNRFCFATTGKNLEKYVMQLNKENIINVMWSYKSCYGETLDEAIDNEILLDKNLKNKLKNHIKKCLEQVYNYKPIFYKENATEGHKKWRGSYSLDGNADRIIIKNKKTGKTRTLDLNKLVKDLPVESQIQIKQRLQNWPPEALMDLAVEVDSLRQADFIDKLMDSTAACYRGLGDEITMDIAQDPDVEGALLHELGHAIDYNGKYLNTASTKSNAAYKAAFKKEMDAYVKAGHKPCTGTGDKNPDACYATTNEREMFAECYCEIVGVGCISGKVIHQYFPETLKAATRLLDEIRSLPDNVRH